MTAPGRFGPAPHAAAISDLYAATCNDRLMSATEGPEPPARRSRAETPTTAPARILRWRPVAASLTYRVAGDCP